MPGAFWPCQNRYAGAGKLSQSAGVEFTTIMHGGAGDSFSVCLGGQVDALIIRSMSEGQDITVQASFGSPAPPRA